MYYIIYYIYGINYILAVVYFIFVTFITVADLISYSLSVFLDPGFASKAKEFLNETELNNIIADTNEYNLRKKNIKELLSSKQSNNKNTVQFIEYESFSKTQLKKELNNLYLHYINRKLYCNICDIIKDKRTHHCRICKKCVIRMDHHCPWTSNCIGKNNLKHFIRFLLFSTIGLSFIFINSIIFYSFNPDYIIKGNEDVLILSLIISSFCLAISIGYLLVYQLHNLFNNITTIEEYIKGFKENNPFYISYKLNFKEIYNSDCYLTIFNCFNL